MNIVLMTNEMHNSYNQFYSTVFCLLYLFLSKLVIALFVQTYSFPAVNCNVYRAINRLKYYICLTASLILPVIPVY